VSTWGLYRLTEEIEEGVERMRRLGRILLIVVGVVIAVALGAYLLMLRPDIPWARLEAKYANAQSRYIDMGGGVRLHYRDQGLAGGPPIVMVHGFSASLHAWEPWVKRLGGTYRIVTLDLPGHGLTRAPAGYAAGIDGYADLVDALARRLHLGPYVVVGNSMGGGVAWDDALRHPDDVRALVLVDAAGWPHKTREHGSPLIFQILASPVGRAVIRNIDISALARSGLQDAYLDKSLVTPALVDRYVELARAPGHRDILMTIQQRRGAVNPDTFHAIAVPTLVMHGEQDRLIPVADGRAFAAAIPGATLVTYPGVGHVPMEQIPDRSAADLKAFLDGLSASGPRPPASAGR
jgi:pimeloyl-ACP methyl ester carboxylesterase